MVICRISIHDKRIRLIYMRFNPSASTYAMEVMKRVAPKNAPETAKEGAALAASRAAFAVSSAKTSTFASIVS